MTSADSTFKRRLSILLTEIFNGPPGSEAFVLNPGDPGLIRQLDSIDASVGAHRAASHGSPLSVHSMMSGFLPWRASENGVPRGTVRNVPAVMTL